jgi:hypothetical protein
MLGFIINEVEGRPGIFAVMITGHTPWYVAGFDGRDQALDWLLAYLTTSNDLANRLSTEREDRAREADNDLRAKLALMMEPKTEKGKEN